MLEGIAAKIGQADVINFAAVACILIFITFSIVGLVIVVYQPDAVDTWIKVYAIIMGTVNSVFVAYGIIKKGEG